MKRVQTVSPGVRGTEARFVMESLTREGPVATAEPWRKGTGSCGTSRQAELARTPATTRSSYADWKASNELIVHSTWKEDTGDLETRLDRDVTAFSRAATRAINAVRSVAVELPRPAGLPVMPDQGTDPAQSARVTFIARG
jgi:hypothetical protein